MVTRRVVEIVGVALEEEVKITLGDAEYLLILNQENFLTSHGNAPSLALVYLTKPGQVISKASLREFRATKLEQDDVFHSAFYSNFVFYGSKQEDLRLEPDVIEELVEWDTKSWTFVEGTPSSTVAAGPYVSAKGLTWQPWRIYHDFNATFMCTFKPSSDHSGSLVKLDSPQAGIHGRVIVPSRCYYQPSKTRPLDGARIVVKDNMDIAGHKTTLCNRSWEALYPAASKNAACVQVLLDAGAIILGKTKLEAMVMDEEPLECVEFTAPFNPRGDGYQNPSGSSSGSAAGIGSYDWLDFSLGSDTNGSGRKPADYNGVFSIRPSTGIIDTDGVVGHFPKFDMPVFFGRDISRFSDFISVWYGASPMLRTPSKTQVNILYPSDYLPTSNPFQSQVIDNFVKGLESALQVSRIKISLAEEWRKDCPDGYQNPDIVEYLKLAGGIPFYHDAYYALADFRDKYKEKFGKPPFVHRAVHRQWDVAREITKEERDKYWRRSEIYRHWLLDNIFRVNDKNSVTIMILPIEKGKPNYRDADPPLHHILHGFDPLNMSPMMRAPELTAIVGEITYHSIVTERDEPRPIGVSVIGVPGTDLILADLVEKGMKAKGLSTKLKTGRSIH